MTVHHRKTLPGVSARAGGPPEPPLHVLMFAWCAACARQVRMLTARQAAAIAGVSTSTIHRWAGAGRVHKSTTRQGSLVCAESLYADEAERRLG